MPFEASHVFLPSLRTTPEALLQLVRERWSLESWHWIRDTHLHEDKHRYCGNAAGVMAVMHDIQGLLAMVRRQPALNPF